MSLPVSGVLEAVTAPRAGAAAVCPGNSEMQSEPTQEASARWPRETSREKRWGLILAGGDGTRLRDLTRLISGDDRPKQFCNLLGSRTLLDQTMQRAARSIPVQQTIVALTQPHSKFYRRDLNDLLTQRLLQPCNRGTAPPIILSLLHIASCTPDAMVAILPSDHYYSDEAAFAASIESAFQLAGSHLDSVVLLGAQPHGPEVEFGWIDLGASVAKNAFRVRGFREKPSIEVARQLFTSGALWNTFVMVGSASAFLWLSFLGLPQMFSELDEAVPLKDENGDLIVPASLYESIEAADFSRQVLSLNTRCLLALRLENVDWHDLGHPDRVISVVSSRDKHDLPPWFHVWGGAHRTARDLISRN